MYDKVELLTSINFRPKELYSIILEDTWGSDNVPGPLENNIQSNFELSALGCGMQKGP